MHQKQSRVPSQSQSQSTLQTHNNQHTTIKCYRCGSDKHKANFDRCPAWGKSCTKCQKQNHFARMCRSQCQQHHQGQVNTISNTTCSDSDIIILHVDETNNPKKLMCFIQVDTVPVEVQIDTGSPISIMSNVVYNQLFSKFSLRPADKQLYTYNNNKIPVRGVITVPVEYNGRTSEENFLLYRKELL